MFTRPVLLQAAPEGTVLALQFPLTKHTVGELQGVLDGIPLVSQRSVTVDDVIDGTSSRRIALFMGDMGERSMALDASDATIEWARRQGLSYQEIDGFLLLSHTLLASEPIEMGSTRPFFARRSVWFGSIWSEGLEGSLVFDQQDLVVRFSHAKQPVPSTVAPGSVLGLTTPVWTDEIKQTINYVFEFPFATTSFGELFGEGSQIIVDEVEDELSLLLFSPEMPVLDEFLHIAGASASVRVVEQELSDGGSFEEILIDPDLVTIEQIPVAGITMQRVSLGNDRFLYAGEVEGGFVLSTSDILLSQYFSEPEEELSCSGGSGRIHLASLLEHIDSSSYSHSFASLLQLSKRFPLISIEPGKTSTQIRFCPE